MLEQISYYLTQFEDVIWAYFGVPAVLFVGIYLTICSRGVQIRNFPAVLRTFTDFLLMREDKCQTGVHPLKAFFACIGGCVGIGNIVGICTAVQLGGPGALFWIWMTALVGVMLKYSEVYLGVLHRMKNDEGGFNGGPMYFLQRAYKVRWIAIVVAVLLCVYGVEVYQFSIITQSMVRNLSFNIYAVIGVLLFLVIFAGSGGVRRVGNISSATIPLFVLIYLGMGSWVLINNLGALPEVIGTVVQSAFTGHAAVGGFAGSSIMLALSQGVRRGCYTGDLGVGYASVIHSESCAKSAEKQASLEIFGIFFDTYIICTTSVSIILLTGVWSQPMDAGMLVQTALSQYFPYMEYFMPFFLFLLGYNTINAYFCVGLKCAKYLAPRWGRPLYYVYACAALILFSFIDSTQAQSVMAISGGLLLAINSVGIFLLRKEISYNLSETEAHPYPIDARPLQLEPQAE